MNCEHESLIANVDVFRLTNDDGQLTGFTTDIKIRCSECDIPMLFVGVPYGVDPNHPTTSIDHTELRAPLVPMNKLKKIDNNIN